MKILHVTAMYPLSSNSGIPAVLNQLVDAQNKMDGIESMVLSLKDDVKSIHSPYFHYIGNRSICEFLRIKKIDVAIIHSFFHIEYVKMASALIKEEIPFFIEPHGSFGINAIKKAWIKKVIANTTIFRQQIKKSKGYIFTNKAELDDSMYRTNKDFVIPNGVLPAIIYSSKMKSDTNCKNPIFYFLGRFDIHHKGLDYMFDALDILEREGHNFSVNIYGTGNDEQIGFVNGRIEKYKKLKVVNRGTIYGDEKKKALESCNILLLTSRYEGSPMTVLDGFSYGNPCIVTPGTNVSEETVENGIGWRTELDANSIAHTIIQANKMYLEDAKGYYDRCKHYVLSNYSWDSIAQYSIEVLGKELLKQ